MAKPKAADQTWRRIYHSRFAEAYESDNENDYYKIILGQGRPKYFYGETAWMDYQREILDYEANMVR